MDRAEDKTARPANGRSEALFLRLQEKAPPRRGGNESTESYASLGRVSSLNKGHWMAQAPVQHSTPSMKHSVSKRPLSPKGGRTW